MNTEYGRINKRPYTANLELTYELRNKQLAINLRQTIGIVHHKTLICFPSNTVMFI
jgi:hypothetical protein